MSKPEAQLELHQKDTTMGDYNPYTSELPSLPYSEWKPTQQTLHLYTQIVGKVRMGLTPPQNHWWHVPLYVTAEGLGTHSIPYRNRFFEIKFDFIHHQLKVITNSRQQKAFDLYDGLSVARFYHNLFSILDDFDIKTEILAKPYMHPSEIPFAEDDVHVQYDKTYIERFWTVLSWVDGVFRKFNSDFYGKSCPVQLYWHSFDLALTRFSGGLAPERTEAGRVDREAYSHELISFGFWPGDNTTPDAAFYSYTYPSPKDLKTAPLKPDQAQWVEQGGSPMALLVYENVQKSNNPEKTLLDFLNSAYQAGCNLAGWNTKPLHKKFN